MDQLTKAAPFLRGSLVGLLCWKRKWVVEPFRLHALFAPYPEVANDAIRDAKSSRASTSAQPAHLEGSKHERPA
jgi:hypothetical protein